MLGGDSICLIENLPPPVPASGFRGKHVKPIRGEARVAVSLLRRKQEVRSLATLGFDVVFEVAALNETFFGQDCLCLQFKGSASPGLPALGFAPILGFVPPRSPSGSRQR